MPPVGDCAIFIFGKPRPSTLTLLSLLRNSGEHIDKIFFTAFDRLRKEYGG